MVSPGWPLALVPLALVACGPRTPRVPDDLADQGVHRIRLDTGDAHGLSGLALAPDGALWTVAERASAAFRIELDVERVPPTVRAIERWPLIGLPGGEDLEALAVLDDGALLLGTEGGARGRVHARTAVRAGDHLELRGEPVALTAAELGVDAGGNHGIEGACALPGLAVLAVEATERDADGRWAPVILVRDAAGAVPSPPVVRRLRLTTDTGKLSGLDCWRQGDRRRAIAIERHFAVTRILAFELDGDGPIIPTVVRDLGPVLRGALNLEGLVRLPDGHLVAVVDNQYGRLTGPDELIWLADVPSW